MVHCRIVCDAWVLMLVDSCALPEHSVTYWKTSMSGAAFRVLPVFEVHAVRGVGACSGHTVQQCPSTAPCPKRSSRQVDTDWVLTLTGRTWTWDLRTRGVPAPKVDLTRMLGRQLTRRTWQFWRQHQQQPNSQSSRVCQLQSQWSVQTTWAQMTVTSICDIIQYRQRSSGFSWWPTQQLKTSMFVTRAQELQAKNLNCQPMMKVGVVRIDECQRHLNVDAEWRTATMHFNWVYEHLACPTTCMSASAYLAELLTDVRKVMVSFVDV